jgi:serine/threonine protein kinase
VLGSQLAHHAQPQPQPQQQPQPQPQPQPQSQQPQPQPTSTPGAAPSQPALAPSVVETIECRSGQQYAVLCSEQAQIGDGGYARVFMAARISDGRHFAAKRMLTTDGTPPPSSHQRATGDSKGGGGATAVRAGAVWEYDLMRAIPPHRHVLRAHDVHERRGCVYLLLELCRCDLYTVLEAYDRNAQHGVPAPKMARYFRGTLEAVAHLHRHGLVHRDVKPENLLLSYEDNEEVVKLCDFGLSQRVLLPDGTPAGCPLVPGRIGTVRFMAPEMEREGEHDGRPADAWSCGLVLFMMLTGAFPFEPPDKASMIARMREGEARGESACELFFSAHPLLARCPFEPDLKALIDGLLRVDPAERMTVEQALRSPWLARFAGEQQSLA